MNIDPLFNASFAIQLHMASAIVALVLGGLILWRRKGTPWHKLLGKVWVGLMLIVAFSSFFINEIRLWGAFSPIHLITIYVLVNLYLAISLVRKGNIKAHRQSMQGTYIGGLIIAGGLTLLPGRLTFEILFGESATVGANFGWAIGLSVALALGVYIFWKLKPEAR